MAERQYSWLMTESCKSPWTQGDVNKGVIVSALADAAKLVISAYLVMLFTLVEMFQCHEDEPLRVIQCLVFMKYKCMHVAGTTVKRNNNVTCMGQLIISMCQYVRMFHAAGRECRAKTIESRDILWYLKILY